jgi:hypothetical protein
MSYALGRTSATRSPKYRRSQFARARTLFQDVLAIKPDDRRRKLYVER